MKSNQIIWTDITDTFSEKSRHYNNTYLRQCIIANGEMVELTIFEDVEGEADKIFAKYAQMYGVIHINREKTDETFDNAKRDIEEEISKNGDDPDEDFINDFAQKYELDIFNSYYSSDAIRKSLF